MSSFGKLVRVEHSLQVSLSFLAWPISIIGKLSNLTHCIHAAKKVVLTGKSIAANDFISVHFFQHWFASTTLSRFIKGKFIIAEFPYQQVLILVALLMQFGSAAPGGNVVH